MSSGLGGLILGGVFGLVLGVLFEDHLKRFRDIRLARLRRLFRRGGRPDDYEEFHLLDLETTVVVVEGDGTQVIAEDAVTVVVDPASVSLPPDLETWRTELLIKNERAKRAGRHYFWNGLSYAVSDLSVSRLGSDEQPHVALRLRHSDYFTFLATQQLDRLFTDRSTPRSRYLSSRTIAEVTILYGFQLWRVCCSRDSR